MRSEESRRQQAAYDRENTARVNMKLNRKTDADILDRLAEESNRQAYIKMLIRADIKRRLSV